MEKESILQQIKNFGQTPSQLFSEPHPPRYTEEELKQKRSTVSIISDKIKPEDSFKLHGLIEDSTYFECRPELSTPLIKSFIRDEKLFLIYDVKF